MSDYLETLVAAKLSQHVQASPALAAGATPEFTNSVRYFPLVPISGDTMNADAWPLIDGQLSSKQPVTVTSNSFSAAYARYLSATILRGGSGQSIATLANKQTQARINTTHSNDINGGLHLNPFSALPSGDGFVPRYDAHWDTSPSIPTLTVDIDVWRPNDAAPWQKATIQPGGYRLKAKLIYSDFRIVYLTPQQLGDTTGWYSQPLMSGMRDGTYDGVTFMRQSNFGDTADFARATAYVMVGRVQFDRDVGSEIDITELVAEPEVALLERMTTKATRKGRLVLSRNIVFPFGTFKPNDNLLEGLSFSSSWDSGDLYQSANAGFLVCAVKDTPLA
ncbi:hypothetical protein [uncultured Tateyamaria sp.]|uniref:hypothetical protein n=1 Tax=uncultured Tateyamaria sp. TaxID=455651 RepID=UPI0026108206|nr:hypothetical protein [uncultured Tateyamaria sp.]